MVGCSGNQREVTYSISDGLAADMSLRIASDGGVG